MNSETKFSVITDRALRAAGWFPGRSVAADPSLEVFRARGIPVVPAAVDFLREFYPLTITVPIVGKAYSGRIFLNAKQIGPNPLRHDELYPLFQEECTPVGHTNVMTDVYVTESGKMGYVDFDWTVFGWLGKNRTEGVEALCDGRFGRTGGWLLEENMKPFPPFPMPNDSKNALDHDKPPECSNG